jgi:hypothetical protein
LQTDIFASVFGFTGHRDGIQWNVNNLNAFGIKNQGKSEPV